jgi:hypothetical protein
VLFDVDGTLTVPRRVSTQPAISTPMPPLCNPARPSRADQQRIYAEIRHVLVTYS